MLWYHLHTLDNPQHVGILLFNTHKKKSCDCLRKHKRNSNNDIAICQHWSILTWQYIRWKFTRWIQSWCSSFSTFSVVIFAEAFSGTRFDSSPVWILRRNQPPQEWKKKKKVLDHTSHEHTQNAKRNGIFCTLLKLISRKTIVLFSFRNSPRAMVVVPFADFAIRVSPFWGPVLATACPSCYASVSYIHCPSTMAE